MVELLLENGANSNICDKFERRPIHWASFVGYTEIIKLLKKYDADINCIDKEVNLVFFGLKVT
jgi:serine/threonine-protein phosphatase 6 regulatory ankyrin repeat subunit C